MSEEQGGIRNLCVVGGGTMGHGITQTAAAAGLRVGLVDLSEDLLTEALSSIRGSLERRVAKGKLAEAEVSHILERIVTGTDPLQMAAEVDLVVEAIPESLGAKRELFGRLDKATPERTILASNTSSLSITEIAAATERPDRVVGTHFFNPVPAMPLLEVIRGAETSDETVEKIRVLARTLGKEVIVVKDTPGFATSRLGVVLGLEAMRMLEQGVATAEDIDRAMELGYRHPMGPLKLTDLVGLDVRLHIARHLHEELGGDQYRPPEILERKVAEGKLGKKSGEGFYRWS